MPDKKRSEKPVVSRPRDESWQAYRDWLNGFFAALTGREAPDDRTEEEWKKKAEEYWRKVKE